MKHGGGKIQFWAAISAFGTAPLKRINGIVDQHVYHSILVHHGVPAGKRLIGRGFVYQADNDPKHSAKKCTTYLKKKEQTGKFFFYLMVFNVVQLLGLP